MAKYGIQYIWDNNAWVEFIPKASLALMEDTLTRKIFTVEEQTAIANYLNTFNVADKLIKLDGNAKFNSDLMNVNADIDMNNKAIDGINALRFADGESTLFTMLDAFNIHTGTDLLKLSSAGTIELTALTGVDVNSDMTVSGDISTNGGISFTNNSAVSRYIEGLNRISFIDANDDVAIEAISDGLKFAWNSGNSTFILDGETATFNNVRLKGLKAPSADDDAATKGWVNEMIAQGTHVVAAARAATTSEIDIDDSGLINAIDGVTLEAGDRVLVWKQENDPTENGVYEVNEGVQRWTKIDTDSDKGSLIFVTEGNTNKSKQFYMNGTAWELFFTQQSYKADPNGGLKLEGLNFSIKNSGVTNAMLYGDISATKIQKSDSFTDDSELTIAANGITNTMLASGISWGKLASQGLGDNMGAWGSLSSASTPEALTTKISQLFTAIKNLRGTTNYNTNSEPYNTQTIAGAYTAASDASVAATGRSKVFYIAAGTAKPNATAVGTLAAGVTAVLYEEVEPED